MPAAGIAAFALGLYVLILQIFYRLFTGVLALFTNPRAVAKRLPKVVLILLCAGLPVVWLMGGFILQGLGGCAPTGVMYDRGMAMTATAPQEACKEWGVDNALCRGALQAGRYVIVPPSSVVAGGTCWITGRLK